MPLQIQEKFRTPNIEDQEKNFPYHIIRKALNTQNKESSKKRNIKSPMKPGLSE